MKKFLVYVDAENLCNEEVTQSIAKVKQSVAEDEVLLGKFYGACQGITSVMDVCYNEGLEYVETSSLNKGSKNVTDMKMVLDCVFDVMVLYSKSVSRVVLLTKDCDFVPLAYKLKGSGIEVSMPLFKPEERYMTPADVSIALAKTDFDPASMGVKALDNQFSTLRKILPDRFNDRLIESYLDRKRNNFLKGIRTLVGNEVANELQEVGIREFSFNTVLPVVKDEYLERVVECYTTKFYGITFNARELKEILKDLREQRGNS